MVNVEGSESGMPVPGLSNRSPHPPASKKRSTRSGGCYFVCQEMYFWKKSVMPLMAACPSGRSAPVTM